MSVPVSVVIPTIGRIERLRTCVESVAHCEPSAGEILVVDQSGSKLVRGVVEQFAAAGARLVFCPGRGVSLAANLGLREARHEVVLMTHDDCTVERSWVGAAWRHINASPRAIVTGRVLPAGDPRAIPSTKDDPTPREYSKRALCGVLFPNNMALRRSRVLALGGFDERFGPEEPAEDNDLCYRWMRAGEAIRYEPDLVIWHHEWRTADEMCAVYAAYARGQGFFYGKHLRKRDLGILRFLAGDLYAAARSLGSAVVNRRPRWTDPRRALFPGVATGLLAGWRAFTPSLEAADRLESTMMTDSSQQARGQVTPFSDDFLREIRQTRRHPRPTQFDYLHLRCLARDLKNTLASVSGPVNDVLDVFCGTRPYEDLLPPGARCIGFDVTDIYGAADVVSDEFLPFPDESFDLVVCTEAFHYVPDPVHGIAEMRRVLRPGGIVVITVPLVWPYDRTILEHRYTGPELAALFDGWEDVEVIENGGRAVSWTMLTGLMFSSLEGRTRGPARLAPLFRAAFMGAYLAINGAGMLLDRLEGRYASGAYALPMNLLLSARRPADARES